MVASFPGVQLGQLFYRQLDNAKYAALKHSKCDYEAIMTLPLSLNCKEDLNWWIQNVQKTHKNIIRENPVITLQSDASLKAWGAVKVLTNQNNLITTGSWSSQERDHHINVLELLAAEFTLKCFCSNENNKHVLIQLDNSTAVAYINNMGGNVLLAIRLQRRMYHWSIARNICSLLHLFQELAILRLIIRVYCTVETLLNELHPHVFDVVIEEFGPVDVDLFASRLSGCEICVLEARPIVICC